MLIVPVFTALDGSVVTSHFSSFSNASLKRSYATRGSFHFDLINSLKQLEPINVNKFCINYAASLSQRFNTQIKNLTSLSTP